jgi:hypothetical protein
MQRRLRNVALLALQELKALVAKHITVEEARLQEMISSQIGSLKHEAKVKIHDTEEDMASRPLISAICSGKQPKPSPISARTQLKKTLRKCNALDLNSQPLADESETPMSTEDDALDSPALSVNSHLLPAEPTPRASSFTRPHTPPPPTPRPTSTTLTGPTKSGEPRMTPSLEPALELMMVLVAIDNMKSSLSVEILKVNKCIDALILNPPDLVPTSQPYDDFGDFTLPTTADHQQFDCADEHCKDNACYTMIEEEIHTEGLYFDLAKILHSSGRCAAFSEDNHLHFIKFLHQILWELGWPLTPATFSDNQLGHLAKCWNVCCTEEVAAMKHFQDCDLFNDLFGTTHPCSSDNLLIEMDKGDIPIQKEKPF